MQLVEEEMKNKGLEDLTDKYNALECENFKNWFGLVFFVF